jgi:hypothetical protein
MQLETEFLSFCNYSIRHASHDWLVPVKGLFVQAEMWGMKIPHIF